MSGHKLGVMSNGNISQMTSRRTFLGKSAVAGVGLAASSSILSSSSITAAQSDTPVDSGTFIGIVRNQPNTADPHIGADNPTGKFLIATYEPLLRVRPDSTELEPVLAEEWTVSDDGLTYTFTLRQNVTFHDGSPLDSEAVKLSFERMQTIGLGNAFVLNPVASIDTPDPHTVRITLDQVYAPFLESIPLVNIASAQAINDNEQDGDLAEAWFAENEAGTGPYVLENWSRNASMTLSKFDDYWRGWGGSHFSELVLQVVPEASTQRQLMESGQADWADSIAFDDLVDLQDNPAFSVNAEKALNLYYIMMNTNRAPLDNPNVRMAMRLAFDYTGLATDILQGMGFVPQGYLPDQYAAHNPDVAAEEFNLDEARALIEEAQLDEDQLTLELSYFEGTAWERPASEVFADNLSQIGITLELSSLPWATMLSSLTESDPALRPHFAYFSATGGTSSPDSVFSKTFYSGSNHWSAFGYENPEVDTLVEESQQTLDDEERTQMYNEIQVLLDADSPGINSVIGSTNHVFKADVQGYAALPFQPGLIDYFALHRAD